MTDLDFEALASTARLLLNGVRDTFVDGVGAPSSVRKGPDDFATEIDLELERRLTAELEDRTGIAVHGEEFGGPALDSGAVWVLDPVDGTFNYSNGLPTAGMLLALIVDGRPRIGLTMLPLVGGEYWAVEGGPVHRGETPLPQLAPARLDESIVAFGTFNAAGRGSIPGTVRARILGEVSIVSSRLRMHGSTGFDLAYTAAGALGGALVFGYRAWDNAAGAFMVQAAGGVVTDLAGQPWTIESRSVLAAAPGVHGELLEIVAAATADRADSEKVQGEPR